MKTDNDLKKIWEDITSSADIKENQRLSFDLIIEDTKLEKIDNKNNLLIVTTLNKIDEVILKSDFFSILKDSIEQILKQEYELSIMFKEDYKTFIKKKKDNRSILSDHLNPDFTFDNFIASQDNKLLYKASFAVSITDTNNWNPLFIHGKSGLGKTHLLNAIGNLSKEKFPNKLIRYIEAKDFGNIVVKAFDSKNVNENLEKIREEFERYDLLLIDDIQFIQSRKKTKEIFFNIFNFFIKNNKQVVVTSDQSPEELKDFEGRFITRFKSGLLLSVLPPDINTAKEILKLKILKNTDLKIEDFSEEALDWIVINFGQNVRFLEGALNRLSLFASAEFDDKFKERKINLEKVVTIFKEESRNNKFLTTQNIVSTVSKYYGIPKSEILGKSRKKEIILPRNICIYLIRELMNESLMEIGKEFNKDHTTILNSLKKVTALIKENPTVNEAVLELKKKLLTNY